MAGSTVRVEGLTELRRAFYRLEKTVAAELTAELLRAAEPVRSAAESYAFGGIRNIGNEWGQMRSGAQIGGAYVAPAMRNRGGSPRPNFGALLLDVAMLPALERKQGEVIHEVEEMLDRITREEGF